MTTELLDLLSEQLKNEFPESKKNLPEVAVRIYNLIMLEQPAEKVIQARKVIKSVLDLVNVQ